MLSNKTSEPNNNLNNINTNNLNNNKETESINKNAHNSDLLEIAKKLAINSTNIIKSSFNSSFNKTNTNIAASSNNTSSSHSNEGFLSSIATKTTYFLSSQSKQQTAPSPPKTITQIINTSTRFTGSTSSVASTPSIIFHHHHHPTSKIADIIETKRISQDNLDDDLIIITKSKLNPVDANSNNKANSSITSPTTTTSTNNINNNTKSTHHLSATSQFHKQQLFQKSSTSNSSFKKFNHPILNDEILISVDDTSTDKNTALPKQMDTTNTTKPNKDNNINTDRSESFLSIRDSESSMSKPTLSRQMKPNESFKLRSNSVNLQASSSNLLSSFSTQSSSSTNANNLSINRCLLKNLTRETHHFSYVIESEGFIQLNQYKLKNEIGKGSYGIVKLAYNDQDNRNYAMKMISKKKLIKKSSLLNPYLNLCFKNHQTKGRAPSRQNSSGTYNGSNSNQNYMLDRVYKEIAILKKLDHQNVVKLIEVLDDPNEDYLCLVFEYFEKGTLIDIPTDYPLPEHIAWRYFRELVLGIEYLHYQKIIHRDIKPSNLLLGNDNHIKIADFGVSNEFDGDDAIISNSLGTPAFTPPEAITEHSLSWLGKPVDIWSLGITLYAFVYGHVPFHDDCLIALRNKILHNIVQFPEEPKLSVSLKDLILRLLNKDPTKRIKLDSIKKHKWVVTHPIRNENCPLTSNSEFKPITVTEDEVKNSVVSLSKLDTLIFIKSMIKKRSFGHPYRMHISSLSNPNSIDFAN